MIFCVLKYIAAERRRDATRRAAGLNDWLICLIRGSDVSSSATLFPDKKKLKDNLKISSPTDTRGIFIQNSKSKSIFPPSASVLVSQQESHLNSSVNCWIQAHLTYRMIIRRGRINSCVKMKVRVFHLKLYSSSYWAVPPKKKYIYRLLFEVTSSWSNIWTLSLLLNFKRSETLKCFKKLIYHARRTSTLSFLWLEPGFNLLHLILVLFNQ